MAIPKVIHYLWLSDEKPANVLACLNSWKEPLKDYKIIEWNKETFPYNDFIWTREAFSVKKWAFVTDVFRLWVLKNYGGIYLDADVVVQDNFDKFLDHKLFIGTEYAWQLGAHVIGSEKDHPFINECLNYYTDKHFIIDNKNDERPLPRIMTKILMQEYKYSGKIINFNNQPLIINDVTIYNDSFFNINIYNGLNICYHASFSSWRKNKAEIPTLSNVIRNFTMQKYFCYDIFQRKSVKQYLLLVLPGIFITIYFSWRMKIKHNKYAVAVKIN
jgi:hypothetical protein